MFDLRAGILVAPANCVHCSLPTRGPLRCACAAGPRDPRGPRHGLAEVLFSPAGRLHA